ncbi:TRAP transporter small permease subunit [Desertibaculum subflavum]|uniref:TRAP transporter small permease subunit n=1 Tax=Desertibaculum subflavum TaxID=2268458 RepID=UPI000E6765C8
MSGVVRTIDQLSAWVGKCFGWMIMVLTLGVSYEVFVRYVLGAPTTWAFDLSYMTYGALLLLSGPYTLSRNGHVRGDVLYRLWPARTQASIDLVLYLIFFFPAVTALIFSGWTFAALSLRFRELSIFSPAGMPVFPLKMLLPVTGCLLFLQGIAEVLRCIICIRMGRWPTRLHDVEEMESIILAQQQSSASGGAAR